MGKFDFSACLFCCFSPTQKNHIVLSFLSFIEAPHAQGNNHRINAVSNVPKICIFYWNFNSVPPWFEKFCLVPLFLEFLLQTSITIFQSSSLFISYFPSFQEYTFQFRFYPLFDELTYDFVPSPRIFEHIFLCIFFLAFSHILHSLRLDYVSIIRSSFLCYNPRLWNVQKFLDKFSNL